jgi:hypothetical protein
MIPVKLEVLDAQRGLIRAPSHCPFQFPLIMEMYPDLAQQEDMQGLDISAVNASICPLCRLCEFHSQDTPVETLPLMKDDRQLVHRAISADQQIMASILKQIRYLQTKGRSALVVLMSYNALQTVVSGAGYEDGELALNRVTSMEGPICVVYGVPLYFSQLLTRSPVQVVGEVEWM